MERCLVLGGLGFIGEYLIGAMSKDEKYKITIADKKIDKEAIVNNIRYVPFSFEEKTEFCSYLENIDTVIHLVSTIFPSDNMDNLQNEVEENVFPTIKLLESMVKEKSKKIVFVSSGGTVYGNHSTAPIKESESGFPVSNYGIIKQIIERYIFLFHHYYGLDYRIIRLSNPYSTKSFKGRKQGIIPILIDKMENNEVIEIWGDGQNIRDYIYIEDAIEAMKKIIEYEGTDKIFNVGNGKGYSTNSVINLLKAYMNIQEPEIKYVGPRKCDVNNNILNTDLLNKLIGFTPKYSLEEGIKEILRNNKSIK